MLWLSELRSSATGAGYSRQKGGDAVDKAAEHLDSRIAEPFSTKELLRHAGLSRNYLERLFKVRFGMGMQAYCIRRKMEYAKFLLESTDLPVKEIGGRVGFPDPRHFNKRFRLHAGTSPTAFRQAGQIPENEDVPIISLKM